MNLSGFASPQEKPEPGKRVLDDDSLVEAANDPVFFEKLADHLFDTRAAIEGFKGTEGEKEFLNTNFVLFGSVLRNIDGRVNEAEKDGDVTLSKSLRALRSSLRFEVEEIRNLIK